MHSIGSHGECWLVWLLGVVDARGYGTVRAILQGSGLGYFGEFSGYTFLTEQSDQVLGTEHRDIFHQGSGTVGYKGRRLGHLHGW